MVAELRELKLKALKQRARSYGVSQELLVDAGDADDTKGTTQRCKKIILIGIPTQMNPV